MGLGKNREIIYGAQCFTGKILMSKNLEAAARVTIPFLGQDARIAHCHGLRDDGGSGLWMTRADVTMGSVENARASAGNIVFHRPPPLV
jgi:hypothetical protein